MVGDIPNALTSVTRYGSCKNMHAYTSVLNPWICQTILVHSPLDATECWPLVPPNILGYFDLFIFLHVCSE